MTVSKARLLLLGSVFASFTAQPALAQDAGATATQGGTAAEGDQGQLGDIIVTAQRQAERLQDVPVAVTAISGNDLASRGLTSNGALEGAVPNLTMSQQGTAVRPYLRGVGSGQVEPSDEPSVATYIDGFYMATPIANSISFNSVERIEVLKGPQGTLFGRNATGGVIQVITRTPSHDRSLEASVSYGNYDTVSSSLYVTGGITPTIAADFAVIYNNQGDGYGRDLATGTETHKSRDSALRSRWLFEPTDRTTVTLILAYGDKRSTANDFQLAPGVVSPIDGSTYPGRLNSNSDFPSFLVSHNENVGFRIDQDLGFAHFISSTGYTHVTELYGLDIDAVPVPIIRATAHEAAKTYSQEFQLLGNETSPLRWQAGIYLFQLDGFFRVDIAGLAAAPLDSVGQQAKITNQSVAGYAQATYEITPALSATAGFRYTWDRQRIDGLLLLNGVGAVTYPRLTQSVEKPTWRLSLDYQVTPDILAYVSYNRGVKSGGYNSTQLGIPGYRPEVLDAYEVGLKTELFDRHLRFNIAAFHYDYQNLQVAIQFSPTQNATTNAASARINGVDIDIEARPFDHLTISGGVGFLDAKYRSFPTAICLLPNGSKCPGVDANGNRDASGNHTLNAPKFTGSLSATYTIPSAIGEFHVTGTAIHKARSFATPDNLLRFPSYNLVNGSIGWRSNDERLGIEFFVNNLFDENYLVTAIEAAGFGYIQSEADPRTYGARLTVHF